MYSVLSPQSPYLHLSLCSSYHVHLSLHSSHHVRLPKLVRVEFGHSELPFFKRSRGVPPGAEQQRRLRRFARRGRREERVPGAPDQRPQPPGVNANPIAETNRVMDDAASVTLHRALLRVDLAKQLHRGKQGFAKPLNLARRVRLVWNSTPHRTAQDLPQHQLDARLHGHG